LESSLAAERPAGLIRVSPRLPRLRRAVPVGCTKSSMTAFAFSPDAIARGVRLITREVCMSDPARPRSRIST
jgi:hypothetical protein